MTASGATAGREADKNLQVSAGRSLGWWVGVCVSVFINKYDVIKNSQQFQIYDEELQAATVSCQMFLVPRRLTL